MQKVLVVIDMQNDFVDGALGSSQAQLIVDNVRKKIESFDGPIIFTRDTHDRDYLEHQEGKLLPVPHCVKNTEGWHIVDGLIEAAEGRSIMSPVSFVDKPNFASFELLTRLEGMDKVNPIESITLLCWRNRGVSSSGISNDENVPVHCRIICIYLYMFLCRTMCYC